MNHLIIIFSKVLRKLGYKRLKHLPKITVSKERPEFKYRQFNLKAHTLNAVLNSLILGQSQPKCKIMPMSMIQTTDSCQHIKLFVTYFFSFLFWMSNEEKEARSLAIFPRHRHSGFSKSPWQSLHYPNNLIRQHFLQGPVYQLRQK